VFLTSLFIFMSFYFMKCLIIILIQMPPWLFITQRPHLSSSPQSPHSITEHRRRGLPLQSPPARSPHQTCAISGTLTSPNLSLLLVFESLLPHPSLSSAIHALALNPCLAVCSGQCTRGARRIASARNTL
jgi:hypothetical protein